MINATGLGKDAPGSPLTDAARFPERAIVWDLNYRGDLVFLDQARAQEKRRSLQVEDGWTYFLHGWTQVIAEVFHIGIPVRGPGIRGAVGDRAERGEGLTRGSPRARAGRAARSRLEPFALEFPWGSLRRVSSAYVTPNPGVQPQSVGPVSTRCGGSASKIGRREPTPSRHRVSTAMDRAARARCDRPRPA